MLYHIVPKSIIGSRLVPLSELANLDSVVAAELTSNYDERQYLRSKEITLLNCLWNQVIHLSPVHPQEIRTAFEHFGLSWSSKCFFEIPLDRIEPNNAVYYRELWKLQDEAPVIVEEVVPFNPELLFKFCRLPGGALHHYQRSAELKASPYLFGFVPHVLFKGEIELEGLEVVTI